MGFKHLGNKQQINPFKNIGVNVDPIIQIGGRLGEGVETA
jgi:hypothetical protein